MRLRTVVKLFFLGKKVFGKCTVSLPSPFTPLLPFFPVLTLPLNPSAIHFSQP